MTARARRALISCPSSHGGRGACAGTVVARANAGLARTPTAVRCRSACPLSFRPRRRLDRTAQGGHDDRPGLPEQVIYHPANPEAAGILPIVSWGNGACMHAGNRIGLDRWTVSGHYELALQRAVSRWAIDRLIYRHALTSGDVSLPARAQARSREGAAVG